MERLSGRCEEVLLFCNFYQYHNLLPVSQSLLCSYVTSCGLSCSTIQSYLSASRNLHIKDGLPEPDVGSMSKTDKLHHGVDMFIGATSNNLCPYWCHTWPGEEAGRVKCF